jgi:hypothetical protein
MPRVLRLAIFVFLGTLVAAQAIRPARTNPPVAGADLMRSAPPAVGHIFDRACRDCHSNETRWPWYSNIAPISWMLVDHVNEGRDHFNVSEWSTYDEDDQDKLLGSVCSLTKRGRMPFPSYLWIHHEARLSASDVAALCGWSDRMRDQLQ